MLTHWSLVTPTVPSESRTWLVVELVSHDGVSGDGERKAWFVTERNNSHRQRWAALYILKKQKTEILLINTNLKQVVFNVLYIFMRSRTFRNFSVRGSTLSLFWNQEFTKGYKKKVNLLTFIGVMGEKFKLFFQTTVSMCWLGSTLGFSYKGYSTNLLHRPQITAVSDYVMSFWKQEGSRRETLLCLWW